MLPKKKKNPGKSKKQQQQKKIFFFSLGFRWHIRVLKAVSEKKPRAKHSGGAECMKTTEQLWGGFFLQASLV